jgi:hypothetical protein
LGLAASALTEALGAVVSATFAVEIASALRRLLKQQSASST